MNPVTKYLLERNGDLAKLAIKYFLDRSSDPAIDMVLFG